MASVRRTLVFVSAYVSVILTAGCDGGPTSPSAVKVKRTTLSFSSDAQHYVGQGRTLTYTLDSAVFQPLVARSGGYVSVVVRSNGDGVSVWDFIITAPTGRPLAKGSYDTTRFETTSGFGMDFFGDGRGCNQSTGHLVIHEIAFGPGADTLQRLRASFDHHCEGASPALHGEIAVLADPWR
jgi:hypothetical protein